MFHRIALVFNFPDNAFTVICSAFKLFRSSLYSKLICITNFFLFFPQVSNATSGCEGLPLTPAAR